MILRKIKEFRGDHVNVAARIVPGTMASLKVSTGLALVATPVALSAGLETEMAGAVVSGALVVADWGDYHGFCDHGSSGNLRVDLRHTAKSARPASEAVPQTRRIVKRIYDF
jgi:hypothetical protein